MKKIFLVSLLLFICTQIIPSLCMAQKCYVIRGDIFLFASPYDAYQWVTMGDKETASNFFGRLMENKRVTYGVIGNKVYKINMKEYPYSGSYFQLYERADFSTKESIGWMLMIDNKKLKPCGTPEEKGTVKKKGTATAKEAKALLDRAVAYYKANGKDKAFTAFNDGKGKFVHRDLYIYVLNLNGDVLSHGANVKLIGQNLIELKDSDGKKFIKAIVDDATAKGTGTMDYRWANPMTKKIEQKSTVFEKVGEVILVCGYYK